MTSVQVCLRLCQIILLDNELDANKVFNTKHSCLGNFNIKAPANVSTEGTEVVVKDNEAIPLRITPGIPYQLPLVVFDEFFNNVTVHSTAF